MGLYFLVRREKKGGNQVLRIQIGRRKILHWESDDKLENQVLKIQLGILLSEFRTDLKCEDHDVFFILFLILIFILRITQGIQSPRIFETFNPFQFTFTPFSSLDLLIS